MLALRYFFLLACFLAFLVFYFPELLCQTLRRSGKIPPRSGQREKYLLDARKIPETEKKFGAEKKTFSKREMFFRCEKNLPKREKSLLKRKKYHRNEKQSGSGKNTRSKWKKSQKLEKYRFEAGKIRSPVPVVTVSQTQDWWAGNGGFINFYSY